MGGADDLEVKDVDGKHTDTTNRDTLIALSEYRCPFTREHELVVELLEERVSTISTNSSVELK
jgi:hypothetical protein